MIGNGTLVWITGAAVVLQAQRVPVWQQPARRAVHVAVTGAPTSQVPDEYVFAGALCHRHANH